MLPATVSAPQLAATVCADVCIYWQAPEMGCVCVCVCVCVPTYFKALRKCYFSCVLLMLTSIMHKDWALEGGRESETSATVHCMHAFLFLSRALCMCKSDSSKPHTLTWCAGCRRKMRCAVVTARHAARGLHFHTSKDIGQPPFRHTKTLKIAEVRVRGEGGIRGEHSHGSPSLS